MKNIKLSDPLIKMAEVIQNRAPLKPISEKRLLKIANVLTKLKKS